MFWNLYATYTLVITLFSSIKHTSNSPLHSRDYVNSIDHSKFDNINNEDLLIHDVLPYIPTSVEPSSSSSSSSSSSLLLPTIRSVSSSISSIPNEEEILRLQLALALQIDSEVNKAIHLENAASESIQQADLLNKAADEAKYRAQLVGQILNSLKQSWNTTTTSNNNNKDNIIDNFSNDDNIHEKRAFIEVPKINQDYLLDEEVGGQIITDYNDNNREKRNQEHRGHHHHQQQQHQRYDNIKKKRNLFPIPDPHNELHVQHLYDYPLHEYIDDDNNNNNNDGDDDNKNIILNDSEQNIKKQLTLEKIRLLILRQLIKQQRESREKEREKEKKEHEQHHLHHYDHSHDNNHNDYLQLDNNVIPLHIINQYPNLYIDRPIWKELHNQYDNDPIDDKQINLDMNNNDNNNYEKDHYGIKYHLWKGSQLNSLDNDDSILFK
ncbi:hypothetical protein MS3_00004439 [Schistosoma haematobium]|uniref:Uncharacterized protein n=1 Tax=Schistosoma haematobium TaxID=6185 RepID=A0A095C2H6_SCHHA|nr:hypothetical protein MS3_00004439 [Schistosoma haematobium]KAH9592555.1 hypothetical protein MS3_00004439 [Schistosoma haematobium]CAH8677948.1 unnamed protein product [Schistosoma haematobium]